MDRFATTSTTRSLADFVVTAITPMEIEKKMKSRLNQEISIVLVN